MAAILNLIIDHGTPFSKQIAVFETDGITVQNLTGATATSHLRKNYTSTNYETINATISSPATNGIIIMSLTAVDTAAIKAGRYDYDLQVTYSDTTVSRIIEGVLTVRPEVTKSV